MIPLVFRDGFFKEKRRHQTHCRDNCQHEEHRPPGGDLNNQRADDGRSDGCDDGHALHNGESRRPRRSFETVFDNGDGKRDHSAAAQSLHDARQDQDVYAGRDGTAQAGKHI